MAEEMMPMSGSDAFFEGFNDNPFHQYMGLTVADVSPDAARLRLTVTDTTPTGIGGSVNGGVLATMVTWQR